MQPTKRIKQRYLRSFERVPKTHNSLEKSKVHAGQYIMEASFCSEKEKWKRKVTQQISNHGYF